MFQPAHGPDAVGSLATWLQVTRRLNRREAAGLSFVPTPRLRAFALEMERMSRVTGTDKRSKADRRQGFAEFT
jgi:hypothetical protein